MQKEPMSSSFSIALRTFSLSFLRLYSGQKHYWLLTMTSNLA